MEKEIKIVLKKTVKIAGVTCLALGGAALIASGAALKALTEGAKFVKNGIRDIINEKPAEETAETVEAEVVTEEEPIADEAPAQPEAEKVETVVVEAE
jgi:hypothetical protein